MLSPVDLMPSGIEHGNVTLVIITSVFTLLSTVAVILRFISRRISMSVKWDDWFSLIALILAYACLVVTVLDATIAHGGYNIEYYSAATLEKFLKVKYSLDQLSVKNELMELWFFQITLAENVLYAASISFSKAAVLLLYHRIFNIKKSFRIASWIVGFLVAGYFIAGECLLIFAYTPIEAQWKPWLPNSANFDIVATWYVMSSINMVVDFLILCLPQPVVWRLKMSRKKKILVSGLFCFGILICAADLMHVVCVVTQVDINNPTATEGTTGIWENVEVNLSVIVTCLPTFPSLISHWRKDPRSETGSYNNEYKKSLNNGDFPRLGNFTTFSFGSGREQNSMDKASYGSSYKMDHMGPVHVQTDVRVKWDAQSHHSLGSMV
ncbi:hypothetical protein N7540_005873 [Penicillium herquei]|nr:hypothetical protein N7540_005873 [Penicillium herquei]